mgnify:FL=1
MKFKKLTALLVSTMIMVPGAVSAAPNDPATRGYVADYLVNAADFYNQGVKKTDIIKGYEDGLLHEEDGVTRAQALVMLRRAFGTFPDASEYAKTTGLPAESFNDIPEWAKEELADVFASGIVAGTGEGTFSPDAPVTEEQLEIFCKRVYALFGTNRKDDFYAAINKLNLDKVTYDDDKPLSVLDKLAEDAMDKSVISVADLLAPSSSSYGMRSEHILRVRRFLDIAMDSSKRQNYGFYPVSEYLVKINSAKTTDQLNDVLITIMNELYTPTLFSVSLAANPKESDSYMLSFSTCSSDMSKEFFEDGDPEKVRAYKDYLKKILILAGERSENAANDAELSFEFEHSIAESEKADVNTIEENEIYDTVSFEELKQIAPNIDAAKLVEGFGYQKDDKICIYDMNSLKKMNSLYTNDNIEQLKATAKVILISVWGGLLDNEFADEADNFSEIYNKDEEDDSDDEDKPDKNERIVLRAVSAVCTYMPEYVDELYGCRYKDYETEKYVADMAQKIKAAYVKRINLADWLSDESKAKIAEKINAITFKIGSPENITSSTDSVFIPTVKNGGRMYDTVLAIYKARHEDLIKKQSEPIDKTEWILSSSTVNACYDPYANDVTIPTAIIMKPFYSKDATYAENLGGIGYVAAHEIAHAIDPDGIKYDKDGNKTDWLPEEDMKKFEDVCDDVVKLYDGKEALAGIRVDGELTLNENICDISAAACITDVLTADSGLPDYKKMYSNAAKCWFSAYDREISTELSEFDVHSPNKLRVNIPFSNCKEFFNAFEIGEKDGMYVKPENRIKVW